MPNYTKKNWFIIILQTVAVMAICFAAAVGIYRLTQKRYDLATVDFMAATLTCMTFFNSGKHLKNKI